MIASSKFKAGFTLFGVFDGRAFYGLHMSIPTDGAEYFQPTPLFRLLGQQNLSTCAL